MMQERNTEEILGALGLRPLSARSVVASVLLGTHPPRLSAAALVELCGRFGITGGTTRVALSRMVAASELAAEDGHYRLIGEGLLSRQRAQDDALDPPAARPWTGTWHMAVVISSGRAAAERLELRRAFADSRFAQWREGVWLRPDNLGRAVALPSEAPVRWLETRPDDDPAALAGELWDLAGWAAWGEALLAAGPEEAGDLVAAEPAWSGAVFAAAAATLRHVRTDPLLPEMLLPPAWPAERLRARYAHYLTAIQRLVRSLGGASPPENPPTRGASPPRTPQTPEA